MRYQDFTITLNELQGDGYPVSALADSIGRVAAVLSHPGADLMAKLDALADLSPTSEDETVVRAAGEALFNWLVVEPVKTHLRLAWDRAQRDGAGLRLRLSIDALGDLRLALGDAARSRARSHLRDVSIHAPGALLRPGQPPARPGPTAGRPAPPPVAGAAGHGRPRPGPRAVGRRTGRRLLHHQPAGACARWYRQAHRPGRCAAHRRLRYRAFQRPRARSWMAAVMWR